MSQHLFKYKHFESEIILLCVRWYLKYPLSYRMLVEMMQERGLKLTHTTIMRWVHQYSPIIDEKVRKHLKPTNDSWRMDETYLKIKGKNAYLYRAVDSQGKTIDFFVSEHRDKDAVKNFFKKALKAIHNQQPRVITTDKYAATEVAIYEMIYSGTLSIKARLRKVKYLNNIIEQDHRFIKRKIRSMLGFDSFQTAEKTICGIELMHMISKGQVEEI
ncbi:MAG: transposase, partial [Firmicutes bacterium]|nr:transposase [Bacillota bacterium]